jgi:hypothetical protein
VTKANKYQKSKFSKKADIDEDLSPRAIPNAKSLLKNADVTMEE